MDLSTMKFEASALDVEGVGKTVLGRFSDSSLGFRICYSQSSIYCEEENLHFRIPLLLPPQLPSGGSPDHWQAFLRCCFSKFMERRGLEVFPRLSGGGCCCPSHLGTLVGETVRPNEGTLTFPMTHPSLETDPETNITSESIPNQTLVFEIAKEVKKLAKKGITAGMRLKDLEDLPQVNVKDPYQIFKRLLDALCKEGLWSLPNDYIVRATIARLARRNLMSHIFLNHLQYSAEITETLTAVLEIASLKERSWLESGVLVECRAMSKLVTAAINSGQWWKELSPEVNILLDAYSSEKCLLASPADILTKVGSMVSHKCAEEFQLLVDHIYWTLGASKPEFIENAVQAISELLALSKFWENLYIVLTCLEWGIHRDKFTEMHIHQLKPRLEVLTTVSSVSSIGVEEEQWRVCEKVATILIKLSSKNLLTDLLEKMKTEEHDPQVSRLFALAPNELYVEPRLHVLTNIDAVRNFLGRVSELQQAKERFKSSKSLKIAGPSGSGKTSLAMTLARSLANQYDVVWKCNADSEANFSGSFKQLAQRLNLREESSELINWIKGRPVLLLLDNSNSSLPEKFRELLEATTHVLFTSRNVRQDNILRINGLDVKQAVNFVIGLTKRETERQEIEQLCQDLSNLPLALKNVSALLNANKGNSVSKIANLIESCPAELDLSNIGNAPRMMLILKECVKEVTSEAGKRLLLIIADLSPDIIPEQVYKEVFAGRDGELERAKKEVQGLSLIEEDEDHNLSVHRLIQEAIGRCYRDQVFELHLSKVKTLLNLFHYEHCSELSVNLSKSIEFITKRIQNNPLPEPEEVSLCIHFVHFCMQQLGTVKAVLEMCQKCCVWWEKRERVTDQNVSDLENLAMCSLETRNSAQAEQFLIQVIEFRLQAGNKEAIARSYKHLASVYRTQGKLEDADDLDSMALKIDETVLSPMHPAFATSYNTRALVYQAQRRQEEAEIFHFKALKIRGAILSPTDPDLAESYYNLALLYQDQERLQESKQFHLKALKIREAILSRTNPDLASSYHNLATVYKGQGKLEQSVDFYLKALKIREKILPPTDSGLASSYHNLATMYKSQGKLDKSVEFYLKALKIREGNLPYMHPDLETSYNHLANVYQDQGKLDKTVEFYLKLLMIREAVLPPAHPDLTSSYHNLSTVYQAQGKLEEAQEFNLKARQIREGNLSQINPDLEKSYHHMPDVYQEEDVQLRLNSLETREAQLSPTDPDLARTYSKITTVYQDRGKLEEAERFYLKALKIREEILPHTEPDLARTYSKITTVYQDQGKLEEALQFYLKALEIREAILPPMDPDLAPGYINLANVYQDQGKLEKAVEFYLKALKIIEVVLPPKHPNLAKAYNDLAIVYQDQGKLEEALQFNLMALKIKEAILPITDPDLASSYNRLATVYNAQGKLEDAVQFYLKALEIREAIILSHKHPDLAESYSGLASVYQALGRLDDAAEFFLKALEINKTFLPSMDRSLAALDTDLALVYQAQGKLEEAQVFNLKALKIREAVLSPTHPDLAKTYINLACVYQDQRKLDEALQYNFKALEIREAVLPPTHPNLATSYSNLATVYQDQRRLEKAAEFRLKAEEIRKANAES